MTNFIIKAFTDKNLSTEQQKFKYGKMVGIVGLVVNIVLAVIKLVGGLLSFSISIIGDAVNNLSDSGSSIVTLIGVKLSSAPPDKEHPFGHGRIEYVTSMMIGALIVVAGVELFKGSIQRILNPSPTEFSVFTIVVLLLSIALKLWLMGFNKKLSKKTNLSILNANVADSRNDVICTSILLISGLIGHFFKVYLDGYMGILVSILVLWSGVSVFKDAISPLIGNAPPKKLVQDIRDTVLSYDKILGAHDIIVHNYGLESLFITLHAEVSYKEDMMKCHDQIDQIEQALNEKYNATVSIHMDPIDVDDPRIESLRQLTAQTIEELGIPCSFHDFRVVFTETHNNLIFDLVVPFDVKNIQKIRRDLQEAMWKKDEKLNLNINVERSFTEI